MIMHAQCQTLGRLDDRAAAVPSLINVRSEIMYSSTNRTRTGKSLFDERVQHQDCVKILESSANRSKSNLPLPPCRLLLLRVYGFGRRSRRLLELLGSRWRLIGSIDL